MLGVKRVCLEAISKATDLSPLEDAFNIIRDHESVDFSEPLKPCPCCIDHEQDLTQPHDVNMGIDYIVCQLCGLRVDRESWNLIPRLPTKKESESVIGGLSE